MADNRTLEEIEKENEALEKNRALKKEIDKYDDRKKKNNRTFSKDRKEAQAALRNMRDAMNDLQINSSRLYRTTTEYFEAWVSFKSFDGFASMTKDLVSSNNEFHRLIVNSGSANISLADASKNLNDLQVELGASFEDAKNVVATLATKQYVGNLKEAAEGAYSLARATGINKEEAAGFTVEFQKTGKLATQTINGIYADILKIQQTNGLTKEGVQAVSQQLIKTAGNMRAFGQSETQIRKMAAGTTQLVSGLEKVGISAQKATGFIDKLLDPEKIEENIGLYSQLGISISDALSGNIDTTQMQNGLKDFGEKVKAMGPIAGAAYAKAFNVSFNDAVKAADLDGATQVDMTPEEKSLEAIKELTENTKTSSEKMSDSINKFMGKIMRLGPVMTTIMGVVGTLIANQIEKAIDRGYREGNKEAEETTEETVKNMEEKSFKIKKASALDAYNYKKALDGKTAKEAIEAATRERDNKQKEIENYKTAYDKALKEIETAKKAYETSVDSESRMYAAERLKRSEYAAAQFQKYTDDASAKLEELKDKVEYLTQNEELDARVTIETGEKTKVTFANLEDKLDWFAHKGGEEWGKDAGEKVRGGFAKAGNWVANKIPQKLKDGAKVGARFFGNTIPAAVKGAKNIFVGAFKTGAGFFSAVFKKDAKKSEGNSGLLDKGGKLGKIAGVFGKVALVGGIIVGLLSPLIAAIKDMDSVKGIFKIFTDEMQKIGKELEPVIDTLAAVGQQILRSITGVLGRVFETIANLLTQLAPTLAIVGDVLSKIFDSIGDILETTLPIIATVLETVLPVISIALGALNLLLKPINWLLKGISKILEVITAPIRWLAEKFGGGQEKLKNATDALEKNTESLEKSNEPQPEQITAGADGSIYTSGVSGTIKDTSSTTTGATKTNSTTAGATKTNSTTQVERTSITSGLEGKIDELNGTVKKLVDIENKKMGNGEVATTIGDRFKESLGILKNGAPLRVSITELSTLAALQMQGGIIGLAASTVQIGKNLYEAATASDVTTTGRGPA